MLLRILVGLMLVTALGGCTCPSGGRVPCTASAPCPSQAVVPEGELPSFVELASAEALVPLPAPTKVYQRLDAATCQCNAATNLTTANLIELERYWAKVVIECDTKNVAKNLCLDRDLLALHATGLRNQAAGSALELFYQLAGLEVQNRYLQSATAEAQLVVERIDKFQQRGIELPAGLDRSAAVSQRVDLEDKQLQLDFLRIQLNGQLQKQMGCALSEQSFFWPELDWQPSMEGVDIEWALATGLGNRSDLRGLELVICQLEKNTLPVARGVLNFAESTVGSVEPQDGVIHWLRCHQCNATELPVRCRQLALFYEETEQGATAEIKNAAYQIRLQQQRVASAHALVAQLQEHTRQLEETRDVEQVSVFEISRARAQAWEAQTKLIDQVVQLYIAQVKLRESQGLLAIECGHSPSLCCEGCCNGACVRCSGNSAPTPCSQATGSACCE